MDLKNKFNKIELFLVIGVAVAVFTLIILVVVAFIVKKSKKENVDTTFEITKITPVPVYDVVKQDANAQKKLINIVDNRPLIATSDAQVKQSLISSLDNDTGILYQSDNVILSYIKSADVFQGEILTVNISQAKDETVKWFSDKGLSQGGACKLPLMFFLNPDVLDALSGKGIVFSPLPPGC